MEMKLKIYKDRLCRHVDREVTANDFELSTGICEDVLDLLNIDMFEGGLDAVSQETQTELAMNIIKNGLPYFLQLIQEIFEITEDEAKRTKLEDITAIMLDIVQYSFKQLASSFGGRSSKN